MPTGFIWWHSNEVNDFNRKKNHHSHAPSSLERCRDEETKRRITLEKITFCKKERRRELFWGGGEGEMDKFTQRANEHNIHTFKSSQKAAKYPFWVCWAIFSLFYHIFCMYIMCFLSPKCVRIVETPIKDT